MAPFHLSRLVRLGLLVKRSSISGSSSSCISRTANFATANAVESEIKPEIKHDGDSSSATSPTAYADIGGEPLSTQPMTLQPPLFCPFEDPHEQQAQHEAQMYRVSSSHYERLLQHYHTKDNRQFVRTLDDASLLIRRPSLELISLLRRTEAQRGAVPRFVLWGRRGNGLSMQLAHCAHWALQRGWLVAHVPEPQTWWRVSPDMSVSSWRAERLDLPSHGVAWLQLFRGMNLPLLSAAGDASTAVAELPRLASAVQWNLKESHPAGTPLLEVLNFGVQRPKYSCDAVGILLRELTSATSRAPPLLLTVDGVNALWVGHTRYLNDKEQPESLDRFSLVRHFRRAVRGAWRPGGGAVLCSVSSKAADTDEAKLATTPRQLLTSRGFHALDPFVPVEVPLLSRREATTLLDWWAARGWLPSAAAQSPAGREELFFLSGANVKELHLIAGEW